MPQSELFLFILYLIILLCSSVCLWGLVIVFFYKYQYMLNIQDVSKKLRFKGIMVSLKKLFCSFSFLYSVPVLAAWPYDTIIIKKIIFVLIFRACVVTFLCGLTLYGMLGFVDVIYYNGGLGFGVMPEEQNLNVELKNSQTEVVLAENKKVEEKPTNNYATYVVFAGIVLFVVVRVCIIGYH
jgi:hypothetical protein